MKPASEGKSDLSRRTVYGYGLGEFGYSFYLNLISSYLMFYMTDVLLLPTKLTGILYSAVQWVEAATALAAGILIDNLFTSKGRYRPWIFRGSVICALSTALLFTRLPLGAAGTATVFVVLYTISYAGYNLMFVAYRAIMGAIGENAFGYRRADDQRDAAVHSGESGLWANWGTGCCTDFRGSKPGTRSLPVCTD